MIQAHKMNITVMVSDMDRGIRFYTETLGLSLKQRYENHYAEIEGPGLNIGLHPAANDRPKADNISIGIGVKNFDAGVDFLRSMGIEVNVAQEGWIRLANFRDPDGNAMYLAEVK